MVIRPDDMNAFEFAVLSRIPWTAALLEPGGP
jgi:hypothetical protein